MVTHEREVMGFHDIIVGGGEVSQEEVPMGVSAADD